MRRVIAGIATTSLVSGCLWVGASAAQAQPGVAPLDRVPFPADAPDHPDWGPAHHWCPGEEPVTTGNHITDPLNWDWNVCHTYYYVWPGMGNVSSLIWDGENPPPKPPPAPALNFCPIPPWCP